jgi:hypothetical protein
MIGQWRRSKTSQILCSCCLYYQLAIHEKTYHVTEVVSCISSHAKECKEREKKKSKKGGEEFKIVSCIPLSARGKQALRKDKMHAATSCSDFYRSTGQAWPAKSPEPAIRQRHEPARAIGHTRPGTGGLCLRYKLGREHTVWNALKVIYGYNLRP